MAAGYRTMDGIDLNDIWYSGAGILAAVDMYRQVELPLITGLAMPWPENLMKYGIGERNGFQVLGPGERPDRKLVTIATVYPDVRKYGYGVGTDLDTLQRSTGREIMLDMNRPMQEDPENVLTNMLKVMMTNPGTGNAGYGFWNGQFAAEEKLDSPPKYQQRVFAASHNHYLVSITPGSIALEDITAAKETVRHHGHNGQLLGFVNSEGVQALENLALFTSSSIIRSPITDSVALQGFPDVFQLLGIMWHVSELIPSGYFLIVEGNGPEPLRPLIMFEPANMRGLRLHPGPMNDYPMIESFWDRWMGFKVFHRGAGVAVQYSTPAAPGVYDSPTFAA